MVKYSFQVGKGSSISSKNQAEIIERYAASLKGKYKRILLLPPDVTRKHSGAGWLTNILYHQLKEKAEITIIPATGTHDPMSEKDITDMFGDIPVELFIEHNWRKETVKLGEIPAEFVKRVSEGVINDSIEVRVNKHLVSGKYDLIISIGQVLPHEVVGMANYSKNIFVGVGGEEMINKSHFIGAVYGLERLIGKDYSPVRKIYDYAEREFIADLPLHYILTVNKSDINPQTGLTEITGLYIGRERSLFEKAVALSQQTNITYLSKPVKKFVVYLDEREFKTTWLGCKAIYRTRMAVADGGEIIIIAPGLTRMGEDKFFDKLIRKYGYSGTEMILKYVEENEELRENLAVAAHLIHGSTEGRFSVTWASNSITREEVEEVGFNYMSLEELGAYCNYKKLSSGYNQLENGEEVYYIENPATGLWVAKEKF